MKKGKVLIVGATGMIGGKLVNSFTNDGYELRILTRDKKKAQKKLGQELDFFEGDVSESKSLIGLFTDIDGVYLHLNDFNEDTMHETFVGGVKNIIELAKFHKVKRIIYQSTSFATVKNNWFSLAKVQLQAEELIKNSNLDYTIVKPGYFMEALKFFLRGNQASIIGEGNFKYNWVAGDEFAATVADIFQDKKTIGKSIYIFGPKSISLEEALKKYCNVLKPDAKFNRLSHKMMQSISMFSNNSEMRFIAEYIKFMDSVSDSRDELTEAGEIMELNFSIEKWLEKQCVNS